MTRSSHLPAPIIWTPDEIERIERHNIHAEAVTRQEIALAAATAAIKEAFAAKAALSHAKAALDGEAVASAPTRAVYRHPPETLARMRAKQLERRARARYEGGKYSSKEDADQPDDSDSDPESRQ